MMRRDLSSDLPQEPRLVPLVLIADDSPTMRIVTRHALERAGLLARDVAIPREVIAAAEADRPELFLLDITFDRWAQTDGYQLCRALRDLPEFRDTPILLVSGHDGFVDRVRGRLAGATGYITKPFEMTAFVERVSALANEELHRRQSGAARNHWRR